MTSDAELSYVNWLYTNVSKYFWLGGLQTAGSAEPLGSWYWLSCGGSVDPSLWADGEPNNKGPILFLGADVMGKYSSNGISDFWWLFWEISHVLCECVSPFY